MTWTSGGGDFLRWGRVVTLVTQDVWPSHQEELEPGHFAKRTVLFGGVALVTW